MAKKSDRLMDGERIECQWWTDRIFEITWNSTVSDKANEKESEMFGRHVIHHSFTSGLKRPFHKSLYTMNHIHELLLFIPVIQYAYIQSINQFI